MVFVISGLRTQNHQGALGLGVSGSLWLNQNLDALDDNIIELREIGNKVCLIQL